MTLVESPLGARAIPPGDGVELAALARDAGVHPELARRLVALGLLEPVARRRGRPLYAADGAARLARALRLRRDLGLNYAGALLVCELLDRIERLELRLRRYEPDGGERWIRPS